MKFVSLGYFCSVAKELEKLGLRSESLPFDWLVSDFEGVIYAIQNRFEGFLEYDNLVQKKNEHFHYKDIQYGFEFFHDFSKYKSLEKQLSKVREKYARRIDRFYEVITEPTIFIRYISDEIIVDGKAKELVYIEKNYENIIKLITSFNENNQIIFIANKGVTSTKLNIYNVEKDLNDRVAREPIGKNSSLFNYLNNCDFPDKDINIKRYIHKEHKKNKIYNRLKRKVKSKLESVFLKEYIHEKQY